MASVYCSHGRVSPFASVPHPFEVVWTSSPNRNYANSGLKRLRPRRPGFGPIQKMLGSDLSKAPNSNSHSPLGPKRCCTYKINTGTRIQRGATCRRRRRCRGEDSVLPRIQITLIRGGIQWGAILSKPPGTDDGDEAPEKPKTESEWSRCPPPPCRGTQRIS